MAHSELDGIYHIFSKALEIKLPNFLERLGRLSLTNWPRDDSYVLDLAFGGTLSIPVLSTCTQ